MEARRMFDPDGDQGQIADVVARIRARAATPLPKPAPDAVARFLAHSEHEAPMSDDEREEHERMWRSVDDEVRALDPSSGTAPGRL